MASDNTTCNDSSPENHSKIILPNKVTDTSSKTADLQVDTDDSFAGNRNSAAERKNIDESKPKSLEAQDEMLTAMHQVISSYLSGQNIPPQPPHLSGKVKLHLVRHAEGPHNLRSIPEIERVAMLDPGLTRYGHSQSVLLSERFHAMDKITHILCSPMRRTVHTAMVGFKPAIQRGVQVMLLPDLREVGGGLCNAGSRIEDLLRDVLKIDESIRKDFIDTSPCDPQWQIGTEIAETVVKKTKRIGRVKAMLYHLGQISAADSKEDVEIVVVTHSRVVLLLEGRYTRKDEQHSLYNAQYRSYTITKDEKLTADNSMYALIETEESKKCVHTFPEDVYENGTYEY
ncbi:uncharacterized protein RAG0_04316 [Rhynchosporium agropyri]|uniref:Phosphoglycerate mutase family protein n=1 Tax=Rhynchosporium agropyri TaxID=914238 RepID=A0A1E1K8N1_9HELO|nr:uncharacterized protein RAG0_04316 [Rhynchosporium agropyri]